MTSVSIWRLCLAEAIGTFVLVFAGTGAIVVNDVSAGSITHVGIALTFGLVVMAMIYALGDISGCHINPAATLAFWAARRFPGKLVAPFMASQIVGALLASLLLRTLFEHPTLGATLPAGSAWQSFVLEVVITTVLMFVALSVSTGAKEKGIMAGAAIGAVVALGAMVAGPICGASMNPARSLAPAIVSGNLADLWIYIAAPLVGSLLAVGGCRGVRANCCQGGTCES
ncbi:MIP/aquaporin family protein [Anatilimnocola aggregata]|nr:aquaporin [Anatilimnocola aggregata]